VQIEIPIHVLDRQAGFCLPLQKIVQNFTLLK
jgi:hypothetical protein